MIGWLSGRVRAGVLVLEVGGVGYEVQTPPALAAGLAPGAAAELFVHTLVREDQLALFGFATEQERDWFRRLLGVAGVGAKTALALLSSLSVDELVVAIESGDAARIARTPGIGRKTAERIVLELRGKAAAQGAPAGGVLEDVRLALANLGYKPREIDRALADAPADDFEAALKGALRALAK